MKEDSDILLSIKRDAETGFRYLMSYYREPVYWHIRRMVIIPSTVGTKYFLKSTGIFIFPRSSESLFIEAIILTVK